MSSWLSIPNIGSSWDPLGHPDSDEYLAFRFRLDRMKDVASKTFGLSTLLNQKVYPHTVMRNTITLDSMNEFNNWLQSRKTKSLMAEFNQMLGELLAEHNLQQCKSREEDCHGTTEYTIDTASCLQLSIRLITADKEILVNQDFSHHFGSVGALVRAQDYDVDVAVTISPELGHRQQLVSRQCHRVNFKPLIERTVELLFQDIEQDFPNSIGVCSTSSVEEINQWNFHIRKRVYIPTSGEIENGIILWYESGFLSMLNDHTLDDLLCHVNQDTTRLLDAVEWLNQTGINIYPSKVDNKKPIHQRLLKINNYITPAMIEQANTFCYLQLPAALEPVTMESVTMESVTLFDEIKTVDIPNPQSPPQATLPYTGKILTSNERRKLQHEQARELISQRTVAAAQNSLRILRERITKTIPKT